MKSKDASATRRQRYNDDHVFRSLVDVIASHFRLNLKYKKAEVLQAVHCAEDIIRDNREQQYIQQEAVG